MIKVSAATEQLLGVAALRGQLLAVGGISTVIRSDIGKWSGQRAEVAHLHKK